MVPESKIVGLQMNVWEQERLSLPYRFYTSAAMHYYDQVMVVCYYNTHYHNYTDTSKAFLKYVDI